MDTLTLGELLSAGTDVGLVVFLLVLWFKFYIPHVERLQNAQIASFESTVNHAISSADKSMTELTDRFQDSQKQIVKALEAMVKRLEMIEEEVTHLTLCQKTLEVKLELLSSLKHPELDSERQSLIKEIHEDLRKIRENRESRINNGSDTED